MRLSIPLLVLACLMAVPSRARAEDPKPRILVVSMKRIIKESDEGSQFVGKLRQSVAEKKKEIEVQVRQLQQKYKELLEIELPDRDPEWYGEVKSALDKQASLKVEEQYFIAKMNDDIARRLNQLLRGAQQEAKAVMKARGAEIVLLSRTGAVQVNSEQELNDEMVFRRVLCASASIDITDEVIARMNKWYRENKASDETLPKRKDEKAAPKKSQ